MLLPELLLFLGDTQYSEFTRAFACLIYIDGKYLLGSDSYGILLCVTMHFYSYGYVWNLVMF